MQKTDKGITESGIECLYALACDNSYEVNGCTECESVDVSPRFGKQDKAILDRKSYYYMSKLLK